MAGEEGSAGDDNLSRRMTLFASKVDSNIFFHKDAVMEYMDLTHLIGDLAEEKARMEQEGEAHRRMIAASPQLLAPVLEQLAAARAELDAAKEEIAAKDEQLKAVTLKVRARIEEEGEAHRRMAEASPELLAPVLEQLAAARAELDAAKEEIAATKGHLAAKDEQLKAVILNVQARSEEEVEAHRRMAEASPELLAPVLEQLAAARAELDAAKDEQLKAVTFQVQEMEAMRSEDGQQSASETALDSVQRNFTRKRSMQGQEVMLQRVVGNNTLSTQQFSQQMGGHHARSDDDSEVLRKSLIKVFMQLNCGGHILGVKEIGKLNRQPFHAACAAKLSPKEAWKKASKLYKTWEKLVKNPSWKPFKTVAVGDGVQEEVIDVDNGMLLELKRTWGEGAHCRQRVDRDERVQPPEQQKHHQ